MTESRLLIGCYAPEPHFGFGKKWNQDGGETYDFSEFSGFLSITAVLWFINAAGCFLIIVDVFWSCFIKSE